MFRRGKIMAALFLCVATVLAGCSSENLEAYDDSIVNMMLNTEKFIISDSLDKEGALQISQNGQDIAICINYTVALTDTAEQTLLDIKDTISVGHTVQDYVLSVGKNNEKTCTEATFNMVDKNGQMIHAKEKVLQRGSFDAITVWYLAYEYVDQDAVDEFDAMYNSIDWSPNVDNAANQIRKNESKENSIENESELVF